MNYPVLIIGAGPSGATTALLLARQGVKSLVISKHKATANTPRAHIFNQRAMEVLRDAGLESQLDKVATPADGDTHPYFDFEQYDSLLYRYAAYIVAGLPGRRRIRTSLGVGQQTFL